MQNVEISNNNKQINELLINELQLGNRLGQAVHARRGGDFGLMLAMMSQNVLDNAEFCLPRDNVGFSEVDEHLLRVQLGVREPISYAVNENSAVESILLGVDLHTEGMAEIKLKGYLNPEPLAMQDDSQHVANEVLHNCEPTTIERFYRQEDKISEQLPHNEAGLYEVLESIHAAA